MLHNKISHVLGFLDFNLSQKILFYDGMKEQLSYKLYFVIHQLMILHYTKYVDNTNS